MKKIYSCIIFLFISAGAFGQAALGIGGGGIINLKDSVYLGTTLSPKLYVKNIGNEAYSGSVYVSFHLGSIYFFYKGKKDVKDFQPGDSVELSFKIPFNNNTSEVGNNVIVVWPTGTDIEAKDTITRWVTVLNNSSSISMKDLQLERVIAYPNPAADKIFIQTSALTAQPAGVLILDINGRTHECKLDPNNSVDVTALTPGFYCMLLRCKDGTEAKFLFMKSAK